MTNDPFDDSHFAVPEHIPSLAEAAPGKVRFDCDLHLHGRHSMGVSKNMSFPVLAQQAARKGIHLVGTSDITHPKWRAHFLDSVKEEARKGLKGEAATDKGREIDENGMVAPGTYQLGPTRFVLTGEVEDMRRVHHVLLYPDIEAVDEFYSAMKPHSSTIDRDGRPKLRLSAAEVTQKAHDVGALFGPAHAFTPWTAMYAYHDSLADCYEDMARHVSFLELGLSAQSSYADQIPELRHLSYITSSDAHSPWPNKFAREFNRMESSEMTFSGVKKALLREKDSRIVLNVGLPPQEGKYNRTGCTRCYKPHSYPEAVVRNMRCKCGGLIKRGVVDRVQELARLGREQRGPSVFLDEEASLDPGEKIQLDTEGIFLQPPDHRPPYLYLIPLGELIAKALGVANVNSKKVQREWELLVGQYGSEIAVSVDAPLGDVLKLAQSPVGSALEAFRKGTYRMRPGCGGQYGEFILPSSVIGKEEVSKSKAESAQQNEAAQSEVDEDYEGRQATLSQFG